MLLISAHILNPFRKLRLSRKWAKGMDINLEDQTSYTIQYKEAFLEYVENEFWAKHQCVAVNELQRFPRRNLVPSIMALGSCQSLFRAYDLSSDDEKYLIPNNVA